MRSREMMMLSFLTRSFGPGLAWLVLVCSYPWWKDAAGVGGVALLTLLQALALAATLLLTAGREKAAGLLAEVVGSFLKNNPTFAGRLLSGGMCLSVVAGVLAVPALLHASQGHAAVQGVRAAWAFGLLGLIAMACNGWTWQAFRARDGRDASRDLAVRSWLALASALRPSLPFVATLGAAAVLLALGALAGSLATGEFLRDRLRSEIEAGVEAGVNADGGRAVPAPSR